MKQITTDSIRIAVVFILSVATGGCEVTSDILEDLERLCAQDPILVNATGDPIDAATCCIPGEDQCTLRAAINTANICRDARHMRIELARDETYTVSRVHEERPEFSRLWREANSAGGDVLLPYIYGDLIIDGNGAVIDASEGSETLFQITPDGHLRIRGLTLRSDLSGNEGRLGGAFRNQGLLDAEGVRIERFRARRGGGIFNEGGVQLAHRVEFVENRALLGAGIFNKRGLDGRMVSFRGNASGGTGSEGTAVYNDEGAHAYFLHSSFEDHQRDTPIVNLGGMLLWASSINNNGTDEFLSNGAIRNRGSIEIRSTTISRNVSAIACVFCEDGSMTVKDATIVRNEVAAESAGSLNLANSCSAEIYNTVVGETINSIDCGIASSASLAERSASASSDESCGFTLTGSDFALEPLAPNGGRTLNHMPGPTSILINAGTACLSPDQRWYVRGRDACDIGAVEKTRVSEP